MAWARYGSAKKNGLPGGGESVLMVFRSMKQQNILRTFYRSRNVDFTFLLYTYAVDKTSLRY